VIFGKRRWGNKFPFFVDGSPELGLVVEIIELLHDVLLSQGMLALIVDFRRKNSLPMLLHGHSSKPLQLGSVHSNRSKMVTVRAMKLVLTFLLRRLTMYVATFSETEGFPNT
jgi:hypothetical protein